MEVTLNPRMAALADLISDKESVVKQLSDICYKGVVDFMPEDLAEIDDAQIAVVRDLYIKKFEVPPDGVTSLPGSLNWTLISRKGDDSFLVSCALHRRNAYYRVCVSILNLTKARGAIDRAMHTNVFPYNTGFTISSQLVGHFEGERIRFNGRHYELMGVTAKPFSFMAKPIAEKRARRTWKERVARLQTLLFYLPVFALIAIAVLYRNGYVGQSVVLLAAGFSLFSLVVSTLRLLERDEVKTPAIMREPHKHGRLF